MFSGAPFVPASEEGAPTTMDPEPPLLVLMLPLIMMVLSAICAVWLYPRLAQATVAGASEIVAEDAAETFVRNERDVQRGDDRRQPTEGHTIALGRAGDQSEARGARIGVDREAGIVHEHAELDRERCVVS